MTESSEQDGAGDSADVQASDGEDSDAEGPVDHAWVMQVTFVTTILTGAPLVAILSIFFQLPTWEARVGFAARVGAVVWFVTAIGVYAYARWYR